MSVSALFRNSLIAFAAVLCTSHTFAGGPTWTQLKNQAPNYTGTMILLTDGTVMVSQADEGIWMRLTPDSTGSYINGTWSKMASMHVPRLYFASQVLPNGNVWVAGGEYTGPGLPSNWGGGAEIYNPLTNTWSVVAPFPNRSGCPWVYLFGGVTTAGSKVVTGILSTAGFETGFDLYPQQDDILSGAQIASIDSSSQIHLNEAADLTLPQGVTWEFYLDATGNTTNGSITISNIPSTSGYKPGWSVFGNGIPANATIASVPTATSITISKAATGTIHADSLQLVPEIEPESCLGDASSMLIPGGDILVADPFSKMVYFYNPSTNKWTVGAGKVYSDNNDEEALVKLQNGDILTYEIFETLAKNKGYAELYNPSMNTWKSISPADGSATGTLPVLTNKLSYEMGPGLRLQDGRVFQVGANGLTALYNPASNSWAAGPEQTGKLGGYSFLYSADDAPGAELPNGNVIFAGDAGLGIHSKGTISNGGFTITGIPAPVVDQLQVNWPVSGAGIPSGSVITSVDTATGEAEIDSTTTASATGESIFYGGPYSAPTALFNFDPVNNTTTPFSPALPDSNLATTPSFEFRMLMLPTGQLLLSDSSPSLWVFTPSTSASATLVPSVSSIALVSGKTYKLTGTQLTGQSAGAVYGDDAQMDENYPIVSLASGSKVYYTRTTNWSTVNVATGSTSESVDFTVPTSVPAGTYELTVSAAGLRSAAKAFVLP